MYSPWTTSMPCLFSSNTNRTCGNYPQVQQVNSSYNHNNSTNCLISSLNNLDLTNPFNIIATISPSSSIWSLNNLTHYHHQQINEQQEMKRNHFEPLPFFETPQHHQFKQSHHSQLSQKHAIIKQMIAGKEKQHYAARHRSYYNSCENLSSSLTSHRRKRSICSFCKSNGESASVYTSHSLRNVHNEIECPILMAYVCPKCGATGKLAHTIKYCTALRENERVALPTVKSFREGRSSSGNMNLFKK